MTRFEFDPEHASALQLREYQTELVGTLIHETDPVRPGARVCIQVATGGGKNVIINEVVARSILPRGLTVLALTKDWPLLSQQASDLCRRHDGMRARIGFVGGPDAAREFDGIAESANKEVVYTTIQTWNHRKDTLPGFDIVLIDEVHWGDDAPLYEGMIGRYKTRSMFVGLTATPRRDSSFRRIGKPFDFATLVGRGVLARPEVENIPTDVIWRPRRAGRSGDVTAGSLAELAVSSKRNELVVRTYLRNAARYGKTLVFACNIPHAEVLSNLLIANGVNARALHSRLAIADKHEVFEGFKTSRVEVLVNVGMMTTGVDIPDIQTLFLTRPTMSEILAAQMIGRGSRKIPGKDAFTVVDFIDVVAEHGIDFVRPEGFLGARGSRTRCPRLTRHQFNTARLEVLGDDKTYEELNGLEVQPNQTFGVEFEFHCPQQQYSASATSILQALDAASIPAAPGALSEHSWSGTAHGKDNSAWNVEPDPSCGLEVTSRILRGVEGFREVVDACRVLQQVGNGLHINVQHPSVGTHVHLGWTLSLPALQRLMLIASYYEPAILSIVAPSRARNKHVLPVRKVLRRLLGWDNLDQWQDYFRNHRRKHLAVNPSHLFEGYGTVEIRYHSGTCDARKILQWISLWMRILATATETDAVPGNAFARVRTRPLCGGDRGDIAQLCEWAGAKSALTARLIARRNEIVQRRWCKDPNYGALALRLAGQWFGEGPRDGTEMASETAVQGLSAGSNSGPREGPTRADAAA